MKKTVLKSLLGALATVFLMSSCLGDSENSFEVGSTFAYINQKDGIKYAATAAGGGLNITSKEISELTPGDCHFISFKITNFNNNGNFLAAENVMVDPEAIDQTRGTIGKRDDKDNFNPTNFEIAFSSPFDHFGDRWLFNYSASLKGKDIPKVYFFFDKDNQKITKTDGTVIEAKNNQLVIDIRFIKIASPDPNDKEKIKVDQCIGNLEDIKRYYASQVDYGNDQEKFVSVVFRYNKQSGKEIVTAYIGEWDTNSGNTVYNFYYKK